MCAKIIYIYIGITRLQRWSRAEKLGQHPPAEVKEILSGEPQDSHMNQWYTLHLVYKLLAKMCVDTICFPSYNQAILNLQPLEQVQTYLMDGGAFP